jgi:hypothetical protein
MLQRLFKRGGADAALDAEYAATCFQLGLTPLGVRFATRAAAALGAPERAEAEAVLKIARERSDGVGADDLANLAQAHRRMGALQDSARLLVKAAERARVEEEFMRAAELARQAWELEPEASGGHREWGLALLACGDAAGARGHLERWRAHEPDCLEAAFWVREATGRSVPSEAERPAPYLPAAALRASPGKLRQVLILDEAVALPPGLLSSLARWGVEVSSARVDGEERAIAERAPLPDLALVALPPNAALAREQLEWLRCVPRLAHVPFLGFARLPAVAFDRVLLRKLGVIGLVDRRAQRDEIAFRVARALGLEGSADPASVRVPVDFEVDVERPTGSLRAQAENLSRGGLRLRTPVALELNERLTLRFRLATTPVELEGRVIHCQPAPEGCGGYAVGVFFFAIEAAPSRLLELEVERLLESAPSA